MARTCRARYYTATEQEVVGKDGPEIHRRFKLEDNPKPNDLILKCGAYRYFVHQFILDLEIFFQGNDLKSYPGDNPDELVIELPANEREEVIFNALRITYFNTSHSDIDEKYLTLLHIAQLFTFGVKYGIFLLQHWCHYYYVILASKRPLVTGDLPSAIVELYTKPPGDKHKLRHAVAMMVVHRWDEMDLVDMQDVSQLLEDFPELEGYYSDEIARYQEYLRRKSAGELDDSSSGSDTEEREEKSEQNKEGEEDEEDEDGSEDEMDLEDEDEEYGYYEEGKEDDDGKKVDEVQMGVDEEDGEDEGEEEEEEVEGYDTEEETDVEEEYDEERMNREDAHWNTVENILRHLRGSVP